MTCAVSDFDKRTPKLKKVYFFLVLFYSMFYIQRFLHLRLHVQKKYFSHYWYIQFTPVSFSISLCRHLSPIRLLIDCPHFKPRFTLYTNLDLFFTFIIVNYNVIKTLKYETDHMLQSSFMMNYSFSTLCHAINHIASTVRH